MGLLWGILGCIDCDKGFFYMFTWGMLYFD